MKQKSISYSEILELETAFEGKFPELKGEDKSQAMDDYITTYRDTPKFKDVGSYIRSDYWKPK